jgi:hypothetical protein
LVIRERPPSGAGGGRQEYMMTQERLDRFDRKILQHIQIAAIWGRAN